MTHYTVTSKVTSKKYLYDVFYYNNQKIRNHFVMPA